MPSTYRKSSGKPGNMLNSVEPGLPNMVVMPDRRQKSKNASRTVVIGHLQRGGSGLRAGEETRRGAALLVLSRTHARIELILWENVRHGESGETGVQIPLLPIPRTGWRAVAHVRLRPPGLQQGTRRTHPRVHHRGPEDLLRGVLGAPDRVEENRR